WFPITGGLFKRTISHVKAVTDMEFSLKKGHSIGLVGESGSGKSTTGMAILKLVESEGSITYADEQIQGLNRQQMLPFR
ncbi:ATP-binding cassette domain-containing protein, partial [Vibrio sp. 10N.261.49.A5]